MLPAHRHTPKAGGNVARFIAPMRPRMVTSVPADTSKWLYEPKLDGYRAIAVRNGSAADLYSIEGHKFNERFPRILGALNNSPSATWCLMRIGGSGAKRPTQFQRITNAAWTTLLIYYNVFDVLHYKGQVLRENRGRTRCRTIVILEELRTWNAGGALAPDVSFVK